MDASALQSSEQAGAGKAKRGKKEEEGTTETLGEGEPDRKRFRVTENASGSGVHAVAADGDAAGAANAPPPVEVKRALRELLILVSHLRAAAAAAAAAAPAEADGGTGISEEQRMRGHKLVSFIGHSDRSVRQVALVFAAEVVDDLDAGEAGTAALAATDAVLASSSAEQLSEIDAKLLESVFLFLRKLCVHVVSLSRARRALRDYQTQMDASVSAFMGLLRRRAAVMDALNRCTFRTKDSVVPDEDYFVETLVDAFDSDPRAALELFFTILRQVAADAGADERVSRYPSGMDAVLAHEAAKWFNTTVAPTFLTLLSRSKDETSSMRFISTWGGHRTTTAQRQQQQERGNGGKKDEDEGLEDARRRYASCAYRCDDAYEHAFGHVWLPGDAPSPLRASAITESGAVFEQEILARVNSIRKNAPPALASAIHNFVAQFKLPKMATPVVAPPAAAPSSAPLSSVPGAPSSAAAPTAARAASASAAVPRKGTEPTSTSTQPGGGGGGAPVAAWRGTLLKNGGRLCCVSIANQITKRGVYQAGDTVTEPEGFRLVEGVNGGKPLHGGITVAAGDAGINVVARGDMSKMLSYVLSKNASQYFVLEMHTATEQKYWAPPLNDRDEAKTFVMSLREKPRAGTTENVSDTHSVVHR